MPPGPAPQPWSSWWTHMTADQSEFDLRFEWGPRGLETLAPVSDAVVIVDVLTFSTAVTVAAARGGAVFPYRWNDETAAEYAGSRDAVLAAPRGEGRYSLSPGSLMALPEGSRIVLPSPNGATLSLGTGSTPTFAGCLRNARAAAAAARSCGPRIAAIACGERWPSGDLPPSLEDQIGAGAILAHLDGNASPEGAAAVSVFEAARSRLPETMRACVSGKELIDWGFEDDVAVAAELNRDEVAPRLRDGVYSTVHSRSGP